MADKNTLNINQYRKFTWDEIKEDMIKLIDPKNVTRTYLQNLFSNKQKQKADGSIEVLPSKYRCTDYFDLPAKIINNTSEVKDTTIGLFLFNAFVIHNSFKGKIGYINEPLDDDNMERLSSAISDALMCGQISVAEFGEFTNTVIWIGYQTELFMPGVSLNLLMPIKAVRLKKEQLLKENPEFLDNKPVNTDVVTQYNLKIEKPLVALAKDELKDDPSMRLYDLGKPKFGNNYKNSLIVNGPLIDPVSGEYKINNNSYVEGANEWNYDSLANKAIGASYSRGVNTAVGGTYAKYMAAMMQDVQCGPRGSDCGTKTYIDYPVTKDNWTSIKFNYALINGKLTRLDPPLAKSLIGKTIKMRSPLFCKAKGCICNKCVGDTFYIMGIKNVGLIASVAPNAAMYKSMKAMHDISIKTKEVDINKYIDFEK